MRIDDRRYEILYEGRKNRIMTIHYATIKTELVGARWRDLYTMSVDMYICVNHNQNPTMVSENLHMEGEAITLTDVKDKPLKGFNVKII